MTMGQKRPVFSDRDLLLPVCLGEEIIISAHHMDHAVVIIYPFLKVDLAALGIAQVISISNGDCFSIISLRFPSLLWVSLTIRIFIHYSPISSARRFFIARSAFPRWLIAFFSSMVISADVFPYSGSIRIGS